MTKSTLTAAEIADYREKLMQLQARLRGDVSTIADHALSKNDGNGGDGTTMPTHMAELGSENFEQEFSLSLMMSENQMLQQVTEAIQRIEDGVFGQCAGCQKSIPKARLDILPFAEFCVPCAEKQEKGTR